MFWATWGHKSPHVPTSVLTSDAHVATLMKWVTKVRGANPQPADAQRFCLAIGIILRDLTLVSNMTDTSTDVPEVAAGLEASKLDPERRAEILEACASAFIAADTEAQALPHSSMKGKGKGKGKAKAADVPPAAGLQASAGVGEPSGTPHEGQIATKRRTTRSSARRQ